MVDRKKVYNAIKNCKQNHIKQIEITKCKNLLNSLYFCKERCNNIDFTNTIDKMIKHLDDLYLEIAASEMISFSELDIIDLYLEEKNELENRIELEIYNEDE